MLQTGLLWLDEDGRVLSVNEQLKWELGYKANIDFPQKTIFQITPYLTFIDWRKIWQQLVAKKEFAFQAECITQGGSVYPVNMSAKLLQLPDRQICFCLVENLLTSRAYQELLEITSTITRVGSWQWNLIQNRFLLGKEVHSLLELPEDFQPTAKNMLRLLQDITDTHSFNLFKEELKHSISTGEQLDIEIAVTLPISKQACQFRIVGVPTFTDNKTVNLYGAFQDISSIATRTDQMYLMEYSVENAFEMIYWVEPTGKIRYANRKTHDILGYSPEELRNLPDYAALTDQTDTLSGLDWENLQKQKVWQGEITLKAKDGTLIPAYTIGNYISYREQELVCIFTRDLREEKKREHLSQVTQYLLNQANDMVYWLDGKGIVQYANEAFCRKSGYQLKEVLGKRGRDFFPEYASNVKDAWAKMRLGENIIGEYLLTQKDGQQIPVEASVSLNVFEGSEYCCTIMRDLTERQEREQELQKQNRLLRISNYALNQTGEMIYWAWLDGTFISVNQVLCEKLGYSESELMAKNSKELFPEEALQALQVDLKQGKNAAEKRGETFITCKDGTPLPVKFHITPTKLDDAPCLCGVLSDISEQKRLETALLQRDRLTAMTTNSFASSTDMVCWVRPDGSFVGANPAFFEKLGYTPEDITTLNLAQIYENFDWETSWDNWELLLRIGVRTEDCVIFGKNQERLEVKCQVSAVKFEEEMCACYIIHEKSTYKDRSDDRSETEKIQELTALMPTRSTDLIYWTNQAGVIVYANDNYCRTIGYEKEEVIGKNVLQFYPSVSAEQAAMGFEMIRQAKNISGEAVLTSKTDEKIPMEQSASLVIVDGKEYFSIVLKDLTEAKRKEEELLERSKLLDITSYSLNHANEMIYWVDSTGAFLNFNNTMCEKLGYQTEELKALSISALFKNNSKEESAQAWEKLRNGESVQGEGQIFRKNGTSFPVEYSLLPVILDGEQYVCGRLTDISERKQKEKELQRAFEQIKGLKEQLESENLLLKEDIKVESHFNNIISASNAYKKVLKQVEQVADTEATVLVLGETGTGKELLARALHQLSRRANRPMVKINCGALPENLIESELFGHEKGAFTGAYQQKKGRFELADKGTIFLDEIGELPLDLQTKLLRVLQEGEFERVGGTQTIQVNVRVIAATNRNLEHLVKEGKFRQDLYYRLNVFPIYNIPLRERSEDIPLLVKHFVEKFALKIGKQITNIPEKTMNKLLHYPFPGNVRELENIIERAVILSVNQTLEIDTSFAPAIPATTVQGNPGSDGNFKSLEDLQRDYIIQALKHTGGQISGEEGAAELLHMNDKTLYSKIKKLNIERQEYLS